VARRLFRALLTTLVVAAVGSVFLFHWADQEAACRELHRARIIWVPDDADYDAWWLRPSFTHHLYVQELATRCHAPALYLLRRSSDRGAGQDAGSPSR
jgi:hypothetical protein